MTNSYRLYPKQKIHFFQKKIDLNDTFTKVSRKEPTHKFKIVLLFFTFAQRDKKSKCKGHGR